MRYGIKQLLLVVLVATFPLLVWAGVDEAKPVDPDVKPIAQKQELNDLEKKFVGKWRGTRSNFKWEIHRKADRTFEIVFVEPDPDRLLGKFRNYAVGNWRVDGRLYKFEWTKWWGDDGDFSGMQSEVVDAVEADRVVTLTEDDIDPNNIEIRVEKFKLLAWKLKPGVEAGDGKPAATD